MTTRNALKKTLLIALAVLMAMTLVLSGCSAKKEEEVKENTEEAMAAAVVIETGAVPGAKGEYLLDKDENGTVKEQYGTARAAVGSGPAFTANISYPYPATKR